MLTFKSIASLTMGVLLLGGCAASTQPPNPCCYVGDVQLARLAELQYTLESGERRPFGEVFPAFRSNTGGFGRALPFRSVPIRLVTYDALEEALPAYDSNENDQLESQELVVLYLMELARGAGVDAVSVGRDRPAGAISLANADISGLMTLASRGSAAGSRQDRIFRELVWLGNDVRTGRSPFDNTDTSRIWLNR